MRYCSNCGSVINEGASFCSSCGSRVDTDIVYGGIREYELDELPDEVSSILRKNKRSVFAIIGDAIAIAILVVFIVAIIILFCTGA